MVLCLWVYRGFHVHREVFAVGLVLTASVALALSPASAHKQRLRGGDWVLAIRHDDFTGRSRCELASHNHRMHYEPGAIGFRVGKRRDTLAAWYRVDGGVPVRWQDRTAALIGAGVAIDGPDLDNPTGGWVWIPLTEVEQAHDVAIRASDHSHVRNFRPAGFATMLVEARRSGCDSDDAFRT